MTFTSHRYLLLCAILTLFSSCGVRDDLPLPLVKAEISALELEGQCDAPGTGMALANIDKEQRVVDVYVSDQVNVRSLYIRNMEVSNHARVQVEGTDISFDPSDGLMPALDFSQEVHLILSTYQTYRWTVRAHQVLNREVEVENQVGNAVIDAENRNVIVYVAPKQSLSAVKVLKFSLAGAHGHTSPNPVGQVLDFSFCRQYTVTYAWGGEPELWNMFVYNADADLTTTASIIPHATRAFVSGTMQNGTQPVVEYRAQNSTQWTQLQADQVHTTSSSYEAEITGLRPGSAYECRVLAGSSTSAVQSFTTAEALQIQNGSFDSWSIEGEGKQALYRPWGDGESSYWDTGNKGATTVGASNSTYITQDGRTFANLESRYIVIKFAAGNIFTGNYLRTDGTNGILSFGRPFCSYPTHLQFDYRYRSSTINRGGGKWDESYSRYINRSTYDQLRGQPDTCQVFLALIGDQDEEVYEGTTYPFIIRTRPSELHLFNPNSENVIAYTQLNQGNSVDNWQTEKLTIHYRYRDRTPKYIIIVASSSKYGDYFVGGEESLLQLDNMKLLYE